MAKILIIDDNKNICTNLCEILSDEAHEALQAMDGETGLDIVSKQDIDVVLLDMKLPGIDGLEVLKRIKKTRPAIEVILISGHGTIAEAVEAMKLGAYDFLEKPLSMDRVLIMVAHALERRSFTKERQEWLKQEESRYQMVGTSIGIRKVWENIRHVAPTNTRVLILGESGTGKELVSFWIHNYSKRVDKPFIRVNCAAIPQELIESELFGYEKGAFTGATAKKIGKFELAHKGTIFLDEIGDMSPQTQAKVLRIVENNEFLRIGGTTPVSIDVRIIAATNKDLEKAITEQQFRADLFHRINVFQIYLPPLRDRKDDIPRLAQHFVDAYCQENGFHPKQLDCSALEYLASLTFPGNIRELKNVIERAVITSDHDAITIDDLKKGEAFGYASQQDVFSRTQSLSTAKNELEKQYLETQLALNNWNISKTAKKLGVQRSNLSRRIKHLGIETK